MYADDIQIYTTYTTDLELPTRYKLNDCIPEISECSLQIRYALINPSKTKALIISKPAYFKYNLLKNIFTYNT